MSVRWWVAAGLVVAGVLSALANFVPWPVAALLGLTAGVLTFVGALWLQREPASLDLAAFAGQVREQWRAELQARGISLSAPLNVRWSATDRPVSAPATAILGDAVGGKPIRVRADGDLRDLAAKFRDELPRGQLVIIGEPGSGKTVLATFLAIDLLTGDPPVPIVLPLSSWDPDSPLRDWIVDRLAADYPKTASAKAWRDLLGAGKLLPVLDGLDEIPEPRRAAALAEINTAFDGGAPFVLTCRATEYEEMVRATGSPLSTALVVELAPVTPGQVVDFLRRPGQEDRWAPVFAAVRAGGPLTDALSSPFMTSLARFAYARTETDPADLCSLPDADAVRRHLLAALLPAAYSPRPHPDLGTTQSPAYRPEQATAWLTFLAKDMTARDTVDFAWWRLHESLTGWRRIALRLFLPVVWLCVLAGGALGGTVGLDPGVGAALGGVLGLAIPTRSRNPGWLTSTVDTRATVLRYVVATTVFLVLAAWGGILAWQDHLVWRDELAVGGTPAGPSPFMLTILILVVVFLPFSVFTGWLVYLVNVRNRLSGRALPTMRESLAADVGFAKANRSGYISLWILLVLVYRGEPDIVDVALAPLLVSAFTWHAAAAFRTTTWLLRGSLPRRLLSFLEDAHARGILRQVGAVYQFRHALLQQHLAGS
ncbi:NACHT domain-containing protein [Actinokineospora auranticolor]|uniref:NACHT domain-containing protein n=1 Tax=Actinokineospora auranticolor TaxID=155976 RepID=A0A2S6GYD3_9PSEU|nr:NACHT domain-containing protein [Actinokineospora auranticolor]PPK70252.1 NACHT domain-containing protein [Actinokineospora auranticolor]